MASAWIRIPIRLSATLYNRESLESWWQACSCWFEYLKELSSWVSLSSCRGSPQLTTYIVVFVMVGVLYHGVQNHFNLVGVPLAVRRRPVQRCLQSALQA